jgi:hypothetical protein
MKGLMIAIFASTILWGCLAAIAYGIYMAFQ